MIKFRHNEIILVGDTHGYQPTLMLLRNKPINGHDIVHLGDVGAGFFDENYDAAQLQALNELCKSKDVRLYVIRGNHDNPEVWRRGYEFSNVFLVQDYTHAEFPNGKTALLVGGAISIDRKFRTENVDYWKDEVTPVKLVSGKYDILLAHDAPSYFNHPSEGLLRPPWNVILKDDTTLYDTSVAQRKTIDNIVENIKPQRIYSGHFHNSIHDFKNGIEYRCLNINEMLMIST